MRLAFSRTLPYFPPNHILNNKRLSPFPNPLFEIFMMNMNGPPGKKGPPQAPPKFLADFSKALSNEVRILLQEVGQLRDERRQLQYEIAELMAVKSKHGAGGEYIPDWRPPPSMPEAIAPPPAASPPPEAGALIPIEPAKPAWRTVVKHERRERKKRNEPAAIAPPPPAPAPIPVMQPQLPSWAQWKPNPLLAAPQPMRGSPVQASKAPDGLFGPRTPPPQ